MAMIIRDPLVADHIREVDLRAADGPAEARRLYEAGNLVLLTGARFDLDYKFLNALDFDVEAPVELLRKLKKYGGEKILGLDTSNMNAVERLIFQRVLGADEGRLAHFKAQVRSGNDQAEAIYGNVFPRYVAYRKVFTWRFTETRFENLHWDNFHIPETFQQVRVFSNVSRSPRLWRISHAVDEFAAQSYAARGLARLADASGDELNVYLNNKVLGGMAAACLDRLPKHHLAFEQGDVWLCETRIVSHQIYHGDKAIAAMFFSDPATMDDPGLAFDARIAALHARATVAA